MDYISHQHQPSQPHPRVSCWFYRRSGGASSSTTPGIGSARANGERDPASVASVSLQSLRAVIIMNDTSAGFTRRRRFVHIL